MLITLTEKETSAAAHEMAKEMLEYYTEKAEATENTGMRDIARKQYAAFMKPYYKKMCKGE